MEGLLAGVDEAGRGPLAGPVVAALVVLDPKKPIDGLNDSKKLSEKARETLFLKIRERALFVAVSEVSSNIIDEINILQATLIAMENVVSEASANLNLWQVLIDGNQKIPGLPQVRQNAIVKGDSLVPEIMAASIIAKVHRDRLMTKFHDHFPIYGFRNHKGYGTKEHMDAIFKHGPCAIHRRSFEPVKSMS